MPVRKVKELLEGAGISYRAVEHPPAYTAMEEAAVTHVPGASWAKTVVYFADGSPGLAVLPATHHVNTEKLARESGASELRIATEEETEDLFPDCELGAMPPFGNLWGVPVIVDESLSDAGSIAFHAGSHRESLELAYSDIEKVAGAAKGSFADKGHASSTYSA
jgi:Ala-tRNA(Pro) deacylase